MPWKSERSKPRGSCSGAMRARFGVEGAAGSGLLARRSRSVSMSSSSEDRSWSSRPMSSASGRRRLLTPRGGADRLTILLRVYKSSVLLASERAGRARRRSFIGSAAWASGGVGSWPSDGGGTDSEEDTGVAMSDCNDRQVVMMLLRAVAEDMVGGLAGGEKKLDWSEGRDGCAESQDSAEGRSIVVVRL